MDCHTSRRAGFGQWGALLLVLGVALFSGSPVAAGPPDAWLTAKSKLALIGTEGFAALPIDVDTFDGRVTLHGKVSTDAERLEAERRVRGVSGVRDVRNLLQVVPARISRQVTVTDQRLRDHVARTLRSDRALANSDVAVKSVHDRVVLLNGRVGSLTDHLRALELASRVPGVKRVASEIESPEQLADLELWYGDAPPRGMSRAVEDAWITSRVKMRLMTHPEIPAGDISVDTENGRVTLFGVVSRPAVRDAASRIARGARNVVSVRNDLRIVPLAQQRRIRADDREIEAAIETRLSERGFAGEVAADVKAGIARMSGRVDSWADRYAALTVARSTEGVRAIRDDLEIATPHANR